MVPPDFLQAGLGHQIFQIAFGLGDKVWYDNFGILCVISGLAFVLWDVILWAVSQQDDLLSDLGACEGLYSKGCTVGLLNFRHVDLDIAIGAGPIAAIFSSAAL